MAVVQYHPYVNAVQWLGTNITEIRQFIRASPDIVSATTDVNNNLLVTLGPNMVPSPVVVPLNNWLVSSGNAINQWSPTDFAARYAIG